MKNAFLFLILSVMIFLCTNAYATSFTLINSCFKISGSVDFIPDESAIESGYTEFYDEYEESGCTPLSDQIWYSNFIAYSSASLSEVSIIAAALVNYTEVTASAETKLLFQPIGIGDYTPIKISVGQYCGNAITQASVKDLTTGETILEISAGYPWGLGEQVIAYPGWEPDLGEPYQQVVYYSGWDPTHIYSLDISVSISCGGISDIWADVSHNMEFVTVPEPSTILLLGSCLIGLAGLRRRLRKQ